MFKTPGKIINVKFGFLTGRGSAVEDRLFGIEFTIEEDCGNSGCCYSRYFNVYNSQESSEELLFIHNLLLKYKVYFIHELIGKPVIIHYEHKSGMPRCLGFSCISEDGREI